MYMFMFSNHNWHIKYKLYSFILIRNIEKLIRFIDFSAGKIFWQEVRCRVDTLLKEWKNRSYSAHALVPHILWIHALPHKKRCVFVYWNLYFYLHVFSKISHLDRWDNTAIDLERNVVKSFFFCRTLIDPGRALSLINVGVKTYAPQNAIFFKRVTFSACGCVPKIISLFKVFVQLALNNSILHINWTLKNSFKKCIKHFTLPIRVILRHFSLEEKL